MIELIDTHLAEYEKQIEQLQINGRLLEGAIQALNNLRQEALKQEEIYQGTKQGLQEAIDGNYPKAKVVSKKEVDGKLVEDQREGKEL